MTVLTSLDEIKEFAIRRISEAGFAVGDPGAEGWTYDETVTANTDFLLDDVSSHIPDVAYLTLGRTQITEAITTVAQQFT